MKQEIKTTGVLLGNRPTDWVAGTIPYEVINPAGDWTKWLPLGEWQYLHNLETSACVSFSFLNVIETLYYFLTGQQRNFSDRFLAIMSGTTKNGNYLWKVADSARKDGLVDEADWATPPRGDLTIDEYWNLYYQMPPIEVVNKARKFLDEWVINYEQIEPTKENILKYLKQSPIQVVIPYHAVMCFTNPTQVYHYFDSYEPFIKTWDKDFIYAQRIVLTKKPQPKKFQIEKVVKKKDDPKCWAIYCGMKFHITTPRVMAELGLKFSDVEIVSEWVLNQFALGAPVEIERIDSFKQFFCDTCEEWRKKYAPKTINKVVGFFEQIFAIIQKWFGLPFSGHIEFLGKHQLGWNCVLYARSRYPSLPHGLWNLKQKKAIINSKTPVVPCVAIMATGWVGHCGIVVAFTGDPHNPAEIVVEETNWKRGFITRRRGSPKSLKIIGYFV